ncbi:MAG: DUF808 domain-containing protein [Pseudomonadota bacterium]
MAGASLLMLLDDIASVLDDVAAMTKVAARKTAGVLGDDLAVNAEKVTGVRAQRELPVVWAVAVGSLKNKLILVPAALAVSLIAPWLIVPAMVLGGLYLCYEGFEKVYHSWILREPSRAAGAASEDIDVEAYEKAKIRGAVRTDFILSAEIIVLTLGVVAEQVFLTQALVLSAIALLMTVGVYGLVAGIVKLDDAGLLLLCRGGAGRWGALQRWFGQGMINFAPYLMRFLGVVGTIAMFMVGGGILVHSFHALDAWLRAAAAQLESVSVVGGLLAALTPTLGGVAVGLLAGALVLTVVTAAQRLRAD